MPAIKCKIAKNLKARDVTQKKIAEVLDVTEAAVSQYLSGKRAKGYKIPEQFNDVINVVSEAIMQGKNQQILMYGVCQICKDIRTSGEACQICKSESGISNNCNLCMRNETVKQTETEETLD